MFVEKHFKQIFLNRVFSSCFQIITDDYTPKETEILLKDESNEQLKRVYQKYNVQAVQVST